MVSRVLDVPNTWIQLSAVTCGGIISGIMKQKVRTSLPRRSVSATSSANRVPRRRDRAAPPSAVSRDRQVARQVVRSESTSTSGLSWPARNGPAPSQSSRTIGRTAMIPTKTTRAASQ